MNRYLTIAKNKCLIPKIMIKTVFAGILIAFLLGIFAVQASSVLAKPRGWQTRGKPVTGPITSPTCKPGWGYGDKNHCHSGPPGLFR